jgi:hypothetical protein
LRFPAAVVHEEAAVWSASQPNYNGELLLPRIRQSTRQIVVQECLSRRGKLD